MTALVTACRLQLEQRLLPTDISLNAGELTCLIGPNGSGKTSLLHALAGIGRPEGEVRIDGQDPKRAPPARRTRLLAYLPASREIVWPLLARDVVALGLPDGRSVDAVKASLELLGVSGLAERRVDRLSTGERSRVLIARVLAADPTLLLLDEPTANLDLLWQLRLMDHLRRLARRQGRAILAAIHDLEIARRFADRLVMMHEGAVRADGEPEMLLSSRHMREVFGVEPGDRGWRVSDQ
jgi:iron complex transport system ATP-binding protein